MTTNEAVRKLHMVRGEIDAVDRSLVGLMADRLELAREARLLKDQGELMYEDPAREAAVVRRAAETARELELDPEIIRDVFWRLIALSKSAHSRNPGVRAG